MIRRCRMMFLKCRALFLEAQIDHGLALLNDHQHRLDVCHKELRRIKIELALITPASTLLAQALRRLAK